MLCEPCTSENLQVQATHFCQTCDDPEPLCDTCASHHTKQKLGKNHKLSKKIEDFTKRYFKNVLHNDNLNLKKLTSHVQIYAVSYHVVFNYFFI